MDAQNINTAISQLGQTTLLALPRGLEIYARPPIDVLPENARELILAVSAAFDVPVEMALACMLAAAFIAVRGKFKIRVDEHHSERLTAYLLVSAASGQRKSAVVEFFLKIFLSEEALFQRQFAATGLKTARKMRQAFVQKIEVELTERLQNSLISMASKRPKRCSRERLLIWKT